MAKKDIRRTLFPFEDNVKRKIKIGGERLVAAFDLIFATRAETDAGIITDKALNPDVGAYAYDRFRYPGQHAAGKGTQSAVIAPSGGVAAIDCKRSNVFEITLTSNETFFANPVNPYGGQVINLIIRQDAAGFRTATFGDAWTFANRAIPTLSPDANKVDLISMQYDLTARKWRCTFIRDFGADGLGTDLHFDVDNVGLGVQIYKETLDVLGTTTAYLRSLLTSGPITLVQGTDEITVGFGVPGAVAGDFLRYDAYYGEWVASSASLAELVDVDTVGAVDGDALVYDAAYGRWVPGASSAVAALNDLTDVDTLGKVDGDVLTYDAVTQTWVPGPQTVGGASALDDLTDVNAYAPMDGDVLIYDAATQTWVPGPQTGGSGGGARTIGASWGSASALVAANCADVAVRATAAGTITKVTVLTQGGTGSCVIDIWNDTYANYPPTVLDTITASAKPTISSGVKYEDATLTGWDKTILEGDVLVFHVDSTSTFTNITILLVVE